MTVAATRTVTGYITNLSAQEITGAVLRLDLGPQYVAIGDTVVVGMQQGTTVGEQVVPIDPDGAVTMDLVAVDNPTWTITCIVDGPNVEGKTKPTFTIMPPPTGTGTVGLGSLLVVGGGGGGTTPVIINAIRSSSDYDNSVAPTNGQAVVWNSTSGKFHPGTVAGGGGSLPSGSAGDLVGYDSSGNPIAQPPSGFGVLDQDTADGRYLSLGQVGSPSGAASLDTNGHVPVAQLTGITASQLGAVPTTRTVAGHALSADVTLVKADVGLGSVDNTADTAKPVSTAQATAIALKLDASQKGAANGVATLDGNVHIPYDLMPPGCTFDIFEVNGVYPDRYSTRTDLSFNWVGADTPFIGSTKAINGVDSWDEPQ